MSEHRDSRSHHSSSEHSNRKGLRTRGTRNREKEEEEPYKYTLDSSKSKNRTRGFKRKEIEVVNEVEEEKKNIKIKDSGKREYFSYNDGNSAKLFDKGGYDQSVQYYKNRRMKDDIGEGSSPKDMYVVDYKVNSGNHIDDLPEESNKHRVRTRKKEDHIGENGIVKNRMRDRRNDEVGSVFPIAVKPLTPTGKEKMNVFRFDNQYDDYRGRRIGVSPFEADFVDINLIPVKKKKETEFDVNLLHLSAKRRSASSSARPRKRIPSEGKLEKIWVPPSMANRENISIDGALIKPLYDNIGHNESFSPKDVTDSDEFQCVDENPAEIQIKEKVNKKDPKPSYTPPELKVFDSQPTDRFSLFSPLDDVPKINIKRSPNQLSPTNRDNENKIDPAVISPPARTRKQRHH